MLENIKSSFNNIELSNILTILLFIISVIIAYYLYFKTFYRLTYSINTICVNCNKDNNKKLVTRILFYNNGRKTITKTEIINLEIITEKKISNVNIIKGDNLTIEKNENKLIIKFDYLDTKKFIVIEIEHSGKIEINGRINETGEILNREPIGWTILLDYFKFHYSTSFNNYVIS